MYKRYSQHYVEEALADTPVVFIMGARQCGKTTLVQSIIDSNWEYLTLDDQVQLEAARFDPVGFIRNLPPKPIAIDEVQRLPELFVSIKQSVDEKRKPGRFLLTGSANALLLPKLSDSLAGRMEAICLKPLSEGEILGIKPTFLKKILEEDLPRADQGKGREYLIERLISGCFPEPLQRPEERRRLTWYQQYVQTLVQRDIQDIANITHIDLMGKFVKLACFYSAKLVNFSEFGSKIGLNHSTVKKYLSLLEQLFLLEVLPAWHPNEYKRLIKTPKLHMVDTGIIAAMRTITKEHLLQHPQEMGSLLESFVYNELKKQALWIDKPLNFYHYRDKDKVEIDIIIEDRIGRFIAIEVKASSTVSASDFSGLSKFQKMTKSKFKMGLILYDGNRVNSFGKNLYSVPIANLWT